MQTILEDIVAYARGDANAAMYSQFDADPTLGYQNVLATDSILNTQRDGVDASILIEVPNDAIVGDVYMYVYDADTGYYEAVAIAPTSYGKYIPFTEGQWYAAIYYALAEDRPGGFWVAGNAAGLVGPGNFAIREVTPAELTLRTGTHWDLTVDTTTTYCFEVTFEGELHDSNVQGIYAGSTVYAYDPYYTPPYGPVATPPNVITYITGNAGSAQSDTHAAMTPSGSYATTYLQNNLDATGNQTSTSLYDAHVQGKHRHRRPHRGQRHARRRLGPHLRQHHL